MSGPRFVADTGLSSVYRNAFVLALIVGYGLIALGLLRILIGRRASIERASIARFSLLHLVFILAGLSLLAVGRALSPLRARAERRVTVHAEPAAAHLTSDNSQGAALQSPKQ